MLKISTKQFQVFSRDSERQFVQRVVNHLEEAYPEDVWSISDHDLEDRIRDSINKAKSFKLESENDVAAFIDLTFELSENFDSMQEHLWATEILNDDQLIGHEKIESIFEKLFKFEED